MFYDENEDGELIDFRYGEGEPITRYKLVCESDIDRSSLPEKDQQLLDEFIEVGLNSRTRADVFKEVQKLLCEYRSEAVCQPPQNNYEVLLDRIDHLSGPQGRPLETIIQEHLVGTTENDPTIQRMKK